MCLERAAIPAQTVLEHSTGLAAEKADRRLPAFKQVARGEAVFTLVA